MRTSTGLLLLSLCVSLSHQGLVTNASLAAAEPTLRPPNIVLVMTDDQGYPPLGRHGHPWMRTPNLDAMYDASTRFTRFLVSPTCSPTRSALMTGRHSLRNGVTHTILERERLRLDAVTLPQVLKQSGYATGIFGKWHLGDEDAYQPHNRGFDEAFIHGAGGIGQAYDCSCADVPGNSYDNPVIRHNGTFVQTRGYCTDVFFSAAMDWIRKQAAERQPFFACITPNAPHAPYVVPTEWKRRFLERGFGNDQASFYGMIENIDQNFGRLMHLLHDQEMLQDTVVIFMSDNGMTPGGSGKPGEPLGTDVDQRPMNFYNAGMNLDNWDNTFLPNMAKGFGLGAETGIEVSESAGTIPDPEWKLANTGEGWATGDAVNMAIGQGFVQVTPLQFVTLVAAIANGGTLYQPSVVDRIGAGAGLPEEQLPPHVNGQLPISDYTLTTLREAMFDVANNGSGTATHQFLELPIQVAGIDYGQVRFAIHLDDMVTMFRYVGNNQIYPDRLGYEKQFTELVTSWRPLDDFLATSWRILGDFLAPS